MLPFTEFKEDWSKVPVNLIGGGPSITGFDTSKLEGITLGANKSAFWFKCDVLGSLDQQFVRTFTREIKEFINSGGKAFLCMPETERGHNPIRGAIYLKKLPGRGLSCDPSHVFGAHTGYANLNLAFLAGAKKINLFGYDMKYSNKGESHCHDGYDWQHKQTPKYYDQWYRNFVDAYDTLLFEGVQITNYVGAEGSLINEFPKRPLSDWQ